MKQSNIVTGVIGLVLGAGLVLGGQAQFDGDSETRGVSQVLRQTLAPAPAYAQGILSSGTDTIADVAERVVPSVVNISATKVVDRSEQGFFPNFFPGPRGDSSRQARSLGSGVVVSADGVVLTNSHVVEKAKDIRITLSDGTEYDAEVVGSDPKSDVAVLRISTQNGRAPSGLVPLPLGPSANVRLGEVVLAVGNPFGVGQTVTMGIVSAVGRADVGIVDYEDFIQTDAAINPGNSGGALVNMRGELVGINTAILSRSGGNQGIGFAIPSDMVRPIMNSLLSDGKVDRGWLGVAIQDVDRDLASALGLPVAKGVLIADVGKNSPAAKGGVQRGDVVQKLAGKTVDSSARLRNLVASQGAGKRVELEIWRDGRKRNLRVTLGSLPADTSSLASQESPADTDNGRSVRGLAVTELNSASKRRYSVPSGETSGVVVTSVARDSAAARAGIRAGDVIAEVNRKAVNSARAFTRAAKADKNSLLLLVKRGGNALYVVIRD